MKTVKFENSEYALVLSSPCSGIFLFLLEVGGLAYNISVLVWNNEVAYNLTGQVTRQKNVP
jgi:hypothetical protein